MKAPTNHHEANRKIERQILHAILEHTNKGVKTGYLILRIFSVLDTQCFDFMKMVKSSFKFKMKLNHNFVNSK